MASQSPSPSFSWVSCIFIEFVVSSFFTSYRISLGVGGGHDLINSRDSIRFEIRVVLLSESEYEYSNFTLFKQSSSRAIDLSEEESIRKEFYSIQFS